MHKAKNHRICNCTYIFLALWDSIVEKSPLFLWDINPCLYCDKNYIALQYSNTWEVYNRKTSVTLEVL